MNILLDVATELLGMFWADARLTTAILLLVALTAGITIGFHASLAGGGLLLIGCLLILIEVTARGAGWHP